MFGSDIPEVFAAQVLFWIFLPFVIFAPPRFAILAWLLMGNLDATGPGQDTSSVVGWINAAKGIALPLWLWWRLRGGGSDALRMLPAQLWMGLIFYAALASVWSPFPIAGAKLVGNMIGVMLMVIVLERAMKLGYLSAKTIMILVLGSLGLAVVQTYVFAGTSYGFDGFDQPLRFSSFVAAQQYAGFLVAFLAILLNVQGFGTTSRASLIVAVAVALALNGSRTWVIGAGFVVVIHLLIRFQQRAAFVALGASTATLGVLLALILGGGEIDVVGAESGRLSATASAIFTGQDTLRNAGLRNLNFRIAMYDAVIGELSRATTRDLIVGHGTSSGGTVAIRTFPRMYSVEHIDANRTIHDEWLRALYEWGAIGLALLVSVFATLVVGIATRYRDRGWRSRAAAVLAFLPAFLGAMSTENVLAGAGNAVMMSLGIVLALFWRRQQTQLGIGEPNVRA